MSKSLIKSIEKIRESSGSDKLSIFTHSLKIDGTIYISEGKCEECHDDFITLENATVCRLSDYCTCKDEECDCNDYICFKYDWLNVSTDNIVTFSMIK